MAISEDGNYTQQQKDDYRRDYGEELPDIVCECGNPVPQCTCG
jgi:hypothetical protein